MHRFCLMPAGLLLAALLPSVIGCGGSGQSGNASVNLSGLPEALRYPYAQAVSAEAGDLGGTPAKVCIFTTSDPIPPVTQYYRTKLSGWKDYPVTAPPNGTASGFTSPDGKRTIVVTVQPGANGKTNLTIYNITK